MKYHNIPFYIASESIKKSEEIGKILSRQINTHFKSIDIPEIYSYLKKCNNFTCFVLQITEQNDILDNIIKSINQKNPNLPIILISSNNFSMEEYRHFITIGTTDILIVNEKSKENETLNDVINVSCICSVLSE